MAQTLLIVDDEKDITALLCKYFSRNGYDVLTALSGHEALRLAEKQPDLILLDINLPDIDGLTVCEKIRSFVSCPILFLTARVEDSDKISGFAAGGDDYIVKPFSLEELGARVHAHLRRESRHSSHPEVRFGEHLIINYSDRTVFCDGEQVPLARKEFDIISFLSQHPGQTFAREQIYARVWDDTVEGDSMVVTEHIRRIRVKLSALCDRPYIETVWGVGYKWTT